MELAIVEALKDDSSGRSHAWVIGQKVMGSLVWAVLNSVGLLTILRLAGVGKDLDPVIIAQKPFTLASVEAVAAAGMFVLVFFIAHYSKSRSLPLDDMTTMRQLMTTVANGFVIMDEAGIVEGVNTVAEDIFGYEKQELVGMNISVILPELAATLKQRVLSRRLATGGHQVIGLWPHETHGRRKTGETLSLELVASEVRGWNKRLYALGLRDTAPHRDLERRINLMEQVADQVSWPLAVYEGDSFENMRYLYMNLAYAAAVGVDRDEMVRRGVAVAAPKGNNYFLQVEPATIAALRHAIQYRHIFAARFKPIVSDGSQKYFDFSVRPVDIPGDPRSLWLARADDVSERVNRARDLQLQSAALEQMDDAIFMFDGSGNLLDCNRSGEALAGRTRQELVGCEGFSFLSAKTPFGAGVPSPAPGLDRSAARHEVTIIGTTGDEIYLEVTISPISGDNGELISTVAVCRDKTKERTEAWRIKLSEERLNRAQAQAQMGSWEFIGDPLRGQGSEQAFRILGLEPKSTTFMADWFPSIHPDDRARIVEWFERRRRDEEPGPNTCRIVRPDGSVRVVTLEIDIERDPKSGVLRGHGVFWDVTDELARTEFLRTLERALNGSASAVLITKRDQDIGDNEIIYVNESFERILGFRRDEVLGRCVHETILNGMNPQDVQSEIRDNLKRFGNMPWEVVFSRPDGKVIDLEVTIALLDSQSGLAGHSIVTFIDVTDRKLADEQNAQAEKLRALGQLTSGVAHDFNNFLAVIRANIEMLQIRLGDDQRRIFADRAIRGCEKAVDLTTSLLAFARKQRLDPVLVNVIDVIESVSSQARDILGPGIRLSTRYELPQLMVSIDVVHLESSILNLVVNSRDAMPQGGRISLEVSLEKDLPPGVVGAIGKRGDEYVCISVIDTGAGMPESVRQRALEPFFTTKAPGRGTGLGLSDVFGFIQQSNGAILIESQERLGTEISLFIPRASVARSQMIAEPLSI